ncbi:MAG: hypothetical protein WC464_07750 [Bdellovibrionales bacterium]
MHQVQKQFPVMDSKALLSLVFSQHLKTPVLPKNIHVRKDPSSQNVSAPFTVHVDGLPKPQTYTAADAEALSQYWITMEANPEVHFAKDNITGSFTGLEVWCHSPKTIHEIERRINSVLSPKQLKLAHKLEL